MIWEIDLKMIVYLFTKRKVIHQGNGYHLKPTFYTIRSQESNFFFQLDKLTKCLFKNICQCHPNVEGPKNQKSEKGRLPPSVAITCWSTEFLKE